MLRWILGYTCLFQFWFPWCVCPAVGLLGHMAVLRIDVWTVVLEKSLESPLDCKEIQSVNPKGNFLKEISPEYSLVGLMLRLKLQYFGHLIRRADSLFRRGWQRVRWLVESLTQWTWIWASSGCWWWMGKLGVLQSMGWPRVGHNWETELNWIDTIYLWYLKLI